MAGLPTALFEHNDRPRQGPSEPLYAPRSRGNLAANLIGLSFAWAIWLYLLLTPLQPGAYLVVAIACGLVVLPMVLAGRWILDRQSNIQDAQRIILLVHYPVIACLGASAIGAVRYATAQTHELPLPRGLGLGVMALSGLLLLAVLVNFIIKGLGLPFAISLTRRLASEWLYAWTRNPMVMSALAFLIGLGLYLRSAAFLVWVLVVASPAMVIFLTVFEERELEIRFGEAYLKYKQRTPMLFPRRPKS